MRELRQRSGYSARALELMILTATRPNEAAGARWNEIDFDEATWTIPAERMKIPVAHVVPLSPAALKLLRELPRTEGHPCVFPGLKRGRPIVPDALQKMFKEMRPGLHAHGLRATFRTWTSDAGYDNRVAEFAMAHGIKNQAERAYLRGTAFNLRRTMMDDWANYVAGKNPQKPHG
jgi:integrase